MNSVRAWIQAARLRTLPLSVAGILVGTAMAKRLGAWDLKIFVLAIATTLAFQITSNYANDYGDGIKGTDSDDRIGPARSLQSGSLSAKALKRGIIISALISFALTLCLLFVAFGPENYVYLSIFVVLGVLAIWAAIQYTVGSKAYGYRGMGDVYVFIFFGLVSVVGSYFLFTKQLSWEVFLPATSIGALSTAVLNLNNMRDVESDRKALKNTLVVKYGLQWASNYHHILLATSFTCMFIYTLYMYEDWKSFLWILAYIPIAIHLWNFRKIVHPRFFDPELKKLAISTFVLSFLFYYG